MVKELGACTKHLCQSSSCTLNRSYGLTDSRHLHPFPSRSSALPLSRPLNWVLGVRVLGVSLPLSRGMVPLDPGWQMFRGVHVKCYSCWMCLCLLILHYNYYIYIYIEAPDPQIGSWCGRLVVRHPCEWQSCLKRWRGNVYTENQWIFQSPIKEWVCAST